MFNQKILAEQGEVFKAPNGQIQKISNNAPSHDDDKRVNKFGINRVNKGDGGVEIDADSVLSDSYRQVENGNRENNVKEQIVKIKPIEGESIAGQLGLDIRLKKAVSPSQLFLAIQKAKDKQTLKILGKSKNTTDTREGSNSNAVNASQLSTLPTDEEIYNAVFEHTEEKKEQSLLDFNDTSTKQYGGEINSLEDDYFNNPLRSVINRIKNTPLYEDWKKIDNQYPTAKDKLSAITALTSLVPNPYIKYGSLAVNTGLDLMGNEMNDKVDLASNVMQIAGKKHQLPIRIAGQVLGTSMDLINPSDDKFKVKKKQYGGSTYPFTNMQKQNMISSQEKKYRNPEKKFEKENTGDSKLDFIYKNSWLLDTPVVGDYLKSKAKNIAEISAYPLRNKEEYGSNEKNYNGQRYTGTYSQLPKNQQISLLDVFFDKQKLQPSKYKPTSDYLEFLPSYSLKNKNLKNLKYLDQTTLEDKVNKQISNYIKSGKYDVDSKEGIKDDKYQEFLKNKNPLYFNHKYDSDLTEYHLGANLAGHKEGLAWDKEKNLPYLSISDAWDFEPQHYSKKWIGQDNIENNKANEIKAYKQAYLMNKAGNPFKIYDRFYFDPKTKEYIPDELLEKFKIKKQQYGGNSILSELNLL